MDRTALGRPSRAEETSWFPGKTYPGWPRRAENLRTHGENRQRRQPAGCTNKQAAATAVECEPHQRPRTHRWQPPPKQNTFRGVTNSTCQDGAARLADVPHRRAAPTQDRHRLRREETPTRNAMVVCGAGEDPPNTR